ncbi:MAG TPA: hypothetical protein VHZ50_14280 [Puia sp.]|nr:hypothetical protein [Puia sp.]
MKLKLNRKLKVQERDATMLKKEQMPETKQMNDEQWTMTLTVKNNRK